MLEVLLRALFGALGGSLVLGLLGSFVLAGLKPFPWWPDQKWEYFAAGAVIGGVFGAIKGLRSYRNRQATEVLGVELSMTFSDRGDRELVERIRTMTGREGFMHLRNVLSGQYNGANIVIATLSHRTSSGKNSSHTLQTIAFFDSEDFSLPRFSLQPEGIFLNVFTGIIGLQDVDFDTHPEFSDAYHLSGDSSDQLRQLFDRSLLDYFTNEQGWKICAEGGRVLVFRPRRRVAVGKLRDFIESSREIFDLFARASRTTSLDTPPLQNAEPTPLSGPLGAIVQANTVSSAELETFLSRPAPREIPPRIARQLVGAGTWFFVFFGGAACLLGAAVSAIGSLQGQFSALIPGVAIAAVGMLIIWAALKYRKSQLSLLRDGQLSLAMIESVERTNVAVNNQQRYLAHVSYQANGMTINSKLSLYGGYVEKARQAAESNKPVPVLFDPVVPSRCVLSLQLSGVPLRI